MSVSGSLYSSASAPWPLNRFFALIEVRSMLFGFLLVFAILVLAYLTNPSESSFRSFLTEQSFRQHLSRLDDVSDDVDVLREYNSDSALSTTSRKQVNSPKRSPYVNASSCGSYTALRFSGRASVSLRTPKHVFRSFGILSIAAIVPSAKRKGHRLLCLSDTGRSRDNIESPNGTSGMASVETWFIGAFGMWWLVAHYDGFWHEAGIASKDEDGTPTGLLDAKSLDHISDISHIKHPHNVHVVQHQYHRTAPKLRTRSRERISNGTHAHGQGHRLANNGHAGHRSSSPPPLPKSATLPLHTKRAPFTSTSDPSHARPLHNGNGYDLSHSSYNGLTPTLNSQQAQAILRSPSPVTCVPGENGALHTHSSLSHSNSGLCLQTTASDPPQSLATLFENSPRIAELIRQLEASRTSLTELRSQLSDAQSSAAASHSALSDELESQRARKRADDASRMDLKARTRSLEEAKRSAESVRRDAEKRLKAVQSTRSGVISRSERLKKEVDNMGKQVEVCGSDIVRSGVETSAIEKELIANVEKRRAEVRDMEEVIVGLGSQVRQMEERLESEKQRLKGAEKKAKEREDAENKHYQNFMQPPSGISLVHNGQPDKSTTTNEGSDIQYPDTKGPLLPHDNSPVLMPRRLSGASNQGMVRSPPEVRPTLTLSPTGLAARSKGYSIFDEDIASLQKSQIVTHGSVGRPFNSLNARSFAPFADSDGLMSVAASGGGFSPVTSSLIPSSLIETLGISPSGIDILSSDLVNATSTPIEPMEASRSFQSDSDVIIERDWQARHGKHNAPIVSSLSTLGGQERSSPISLSPVSSSAMATEQDPFEVRVSHQNQRGFDEFGVLNRVDQRMTLPPRTTQLVAQDFSVPQRVRVESLPVASIDRPAPATDSNRWIFGKEKKRLNPDAKEFSLSKETELKLLSKNANVTVARDNVPPMVPGLVPSEPTFDMIKSTLGTPPLMHSQATHSSSTSSVLSTPSMSPFGSWFGAFTPSPEERKKLNPSLGSSNNTSLEQLTSLDVPSLPESPKPGYVNHSHGHPQVQSLINGSSLWSSDSSPLRPKLKFSPFADDEPVPPPPPTKATAINGSLDSRICAHQEESSRGASRLKIVERSMTK